jgi:hypothetical protein
MNPTATDYERLARTVCLARGDDPDAPEKTMTGEIPRWELEAIDEDNSCVSATRETLDDFRRNSREWQEPGVCQEINGGLYWERCQALRGQPRYELCIVDCGDFRLIYQV